MRKRDLAAAVLGHPLSVGMWRAARGSEGALRILAYHRVLDDDARDFDFDDDLISATSEAFRRQMEFARRHFDVLSFRDLLACEREGRAWPRRALIITFDDGYRDNYTNAFPILREMQLPATIFLATGHIGETKLFWWDALAYAVKRTPRASLHLPEVRQEPFDLATPRARRRALRHILNWIKQVPETVKADFLSRLRETFDVEVDDRLAEGMHLNWDEVREMAAHGIEFGSHTVTHPILARVEEQQLEAELFESKRAIESNLGTEVISFAYPAGRRSRFNQQSRQAVARHGFRYALSYEEGLVEAANCDRFAMPRIHVERGDSMALFRANLLFPRLMLKAESRDAGRNASRSRELGHAALRQSNAMEAKEN